MCTVIRWVGRNVIDYLKLLDANVTRGLTLSLSLCLSLSLSLSLPLPLSISLFLSLSLLYSQALLALLDAEFTRRFGGVCYPYP